MFTSKRLELHKIQNSFLSRIDPKENDKISGKEKEKERKEGGIKVNRDESVGEEGQYEKEEDDDEEKDDDDEEDNNEEVDENEKENSLKNGILKEERKEEDIPNDCTVVKPQFKTSSQSKELHRVARSFYGEMGSTSSQGYVLITHFSFFSAKSLLGKSS